MLTHDERQRLLRLARETLAHHLGGAPAPGPVELEDASCHSGAFVTLHVDRELRGCIGYPGSQDPLDQVVARCAIAAATEDPRFTSVEADELPRTSIEISVLTPIMPVTDIGNIEVGRDGLVMEQGYRRGLLLPQVASEYRLGPRDVPLPYLSQGRPASQRVEDGGEDLHVPGGGVLGG